MSKRNYSLEKFHRESLQLTRWVKARPNYNNVFSFEHCRNFPGDRYYGLRITLRGGKMHGSPFEKIEFTPSEDGTTLEIFVTKVDRNARCGISFESHNIPLTRFTTKTRKERMLDTTEAIFRFIHEWINAVRNNYVYGMRVNKEKVLRCFYQALAQAHMSA